MLIKTKSRLAWANDLTFQYSFQPSTGQIIKIDQSFFQVVANERYSVPGDFRTVPDWEVTIAPVLETITMPIAEIPSNPFVSPFSLPSLFNRSFIAGILLITLGCGTLGYLHGPAILRQLTQVRSK